MVKKKMFLVMCLCLMGVRPGTAPRSHRLSIGSNIYKHSMVSTTVFSSQCMSLLD